jgi:hypothetical protein
MTTCGFDLMSQAVDNRVYILVYWVGAFLLPLLVIGFCYTSVVRYVSVNCPDWRVQVIRRGEIPADNSHRFRYGHVIVTLLTIILLLLSKY